MAASSARTPSPCCIQGCLRKFIDFMWQDSVHCTTIGSFWRYGYTGWRRKWTKHCKTQSKSPMLSKSCIEKSLVRSYILSAANCIWNGFVGPIPKEHMKYSLEPGEWLGRLANEADNTFCTKKKIHSSCFQTARTIFVQRCLGHWCLAVLLFPMSLVTRMGNVCACVATPVVQAGSAKSTNDPCKLEDTKFRKFVRTIPPGGLHSSDLQRCTRLPTCGHGDVWNNIGNQHLNFQLPRQPLLETGTNLPRPRRTWDSQIHMYGPWKAYLLVWGNMRERKFSALQHEACTSQNMTPCHGTKGRLKVAQAIETFRSRRIQFRLCPSIRATRFSSQPQFDGLNIFPKW